MSTTTMSQRNPKKVQKISGQRRKLKKKRQNKTNKKLPIENEENGEPIINEKDRIILANENEELTKNDCDLMPFIEDELCKEHSDCIEEPTIEVEDQPLREVEDQKVIEEEPVIEVEDQPLREVEEQKVIEVEEQKVIEEEPLIEEKGDSTTKEFTTKEIFTKSSHELKKKELQKKKQNQKKSHKLAIVVIRPRI